MARVEIIPFNQAPHQQLAARAMGSTRHQSGACIVAPGIIPIVAVRVQAVQSSPKLTTGSGVTWKDTLTALTIMDHVPAHVKTLVRTYTPVPCVSQEITVLNRALYDSLFPIRMKLHWEAWHNTLSSLGLILYHHAFYLYSYS